MIGPAGGRAWMFGCRGRSRWVLVPFVGRWVKGLDRIFRAESPGRAKVLASEELAEGAIFSAGSAGSAGGFPWRRARRAGKMGCD